uniref:Trafficking protein particle complex subunit n=1 Tax=Haptolina brevifila TaxID=156173 RepID=A0A7S2FMG2_9EUKA
MSRRGRSALDRPLPMRGKNEVGLSAFAFLFSEFIQYSQQRVNTAEELERKLEDAGVGIGRRVLELGCLREKSSKRETRMLGILNFITSVVWKMLFGNSADSLEKAVEQEDEFMIVEKAPIVNTYISNAPCSCAAFVAGIVRGVLEGAQFPASVSAHEQEDSRTVILIKFAPEVLEREKRLAS